MPGPAPDPRSRRSQQRSASVVSLPSRGRRGRTPAWPLEGEPPSTWAAVWKLPQAVEWERLRLHRVVARYALLLVLVERDEAVAALLSEARQMEDRLGLSPMAMARLRWEIVDEPASRPAPVADLDDFRRLYG